MKTGPAAAVRLSCLPNKVDGPLFQLILFRPGEARQHRTNSGSIRCPQEARLRAKPECVCEKATQSRDGPPGAMEMRAWSRLRKTALYLVPSYSRHSKRHIWSIVRMTAELKSHDFSIRPHIIPHNSLIFVGDGQKALFLRNRGSALDVDLVVEQIFERDNPATREQGTDRPGRSTASFGVARSAMEEVDWHHIAKERFAKEIAEALYHHAHANLFDRLIIIAPPKILGQLRKMFHVEVIARIAAEIPKELTSHPVSRAAFRKFYQAMRER
jgi:protein required for attachment to host cells